MDVAYFLIHSMEPAAQDPFASRERIAAERFAAAAQAAGIDRIVYLGGLVPAAGPRSAHLASRMAVEQILQEAVPESVALRASIVIGARSRSFRFLVRLVERLPVLAVPAWRNNAPHRSTSVTWWNCSRPPLSVKKRRGPPWTWVALTSFPTAS